MTAPRGAGEATQLDDGDAAAVFDGICRRELGMSGAEFLGRWDAGGYAGVDVDEVDGLADVVGVISLVR